MEYMEEGLFAYSSPDEPEDEKRIFRDVVVRGWRQGNVPWVVSFREPPIGMRKGYYSCENEEWQSLPFVEKVME